MEHKLQQRNSVSICSTFNECKSMYLYTFVFFSVSADINAVQITCDEYLEQFALVFSPVLQHALEIPLFANDTDCASALTSHVFWRRLLDTNTCCHQQNNINTFQIKIILGCHSYRTSCDNSSTKLIESITLHILKVLKIKTKMNLVS